MDIKLIHNDISQIVRDTNRAADEVNKSVLHHMGKAVRILIGNLVNKTPRGATGRLKTSYYSKITKRGNSVVGLVTHMDDAYYAVHVNDGTQPHPVSAKRLIPWATAKLGSPVAAYAVAHKIREKGSPGQFFFEKALDESKPAIETELDKVPIGFGGSA